MEHDLLTIGYRISSFVPPVNEALNPLEYGWQLIEGVHVSVWYNFLQLQTQEEIRHHQETIYKNPTCN